MTDMSLSELGGGQLAWEYRIETLTQGETTFVGREGGPVGIPDHLNNLGAEGWELVQVIGQLEKAGDKLEMYLKRPFLREANPKG